MHHFGGQGKNPVLAVLRRSVPYLPALRPIAGSVTAALMLQQLDYLWYSSPKAEIEKWGGIVVFAEPAENNSEYRLGRSFSEMLAFSEDERRTAFSKIGVAYNTQAQLDEVISAGRDPFQGKFWLSFRVRIKQITVYVRNSRLLDEVLAELMAAGDPQLRREATWEGNESPKPEFSAPEGGDTRFTETGNPGLGRWGYPVYGDGESRFRETGNPDMGAAPAEISGNAQNPSAASISAIAQKTGHINAHAHAHAQDPGLDLDLDLINLDLVNLGQVLGQVGQVDLGRKDLGRKEKTNQKPPIPPTQGGQDGGVRLEHPELGLGERDRPEPEPALTGLPANAGCLGEGCQKNGKASRNGHSGAFSAAHLIKPVSEPPSKIAYKPPLDTPNDESYLRPPQEGLEQPLTPLSVNVQFEGEGLEDLNQPSLLSFPKEKPSPKRTKASFTEEVAKALVAEYNAHCPENWAKVQRLSTPRRNALKRLWTDCDCDLETTRSTIRYACWQRSTEPWWAKTALERRMSGSSAFGLETLLANGKAVTAAEQWLEKHPENPEEKPDPAKLSQQNRILESKVAAQKDEEAENSDPSTWSEEQRFKCLRFFWDCRRDWEICRAWLYNKYSAKIAARKMRALYAWHDYAETQYSKGLYPQLEDISLDPLYRD